MVSGSTVLGVEGGVDSLSEKLGRDWMWVVPITSFKSVVTQANDIYRQVHYYNSTKSMCVLIPDRLPLPLKDFFFLKALLIFLRELVFLREKTAVSGTWIASSALVGSGVLG